MSLASQIIKNNDLLIRSTRDYIENAINNELDKDDIWKGLAHVRLFSAECHKVMITEMIQAIEQERVMDEIRSDLFYCINCTYGIYCYNS